MEAIALEKKNNLTDSRVEKIFGKIYMMAGASARHQDVVFNIAFNLRILNKKEKCKLRVAPFDVKIKCKEKNIVQPDVMIFCEDKLCGVFEVLSPSTAMKDKIIKKRLYECGGVKEYFIIESEYKIVEKFELVDGKYEFIGNFSIEDKLEVKCLDENIEVSKIFENID